jgi:hypothetical protein
MSFLDGLSKIAAPVINSGADALKAGIKAGKNAIESILQGNIGSSVGKKSFSAGKTFSQKYNELTHTVELWLDNSGDLKEVATKVYPINPAAVMELKMTNNLNDWNVTGSMTFMYMPEDAPPAQEPSLGQKILSFITGALENAETMKTFQFRGDGYDLLRVSIIPITREGEAESGDSLRIQEGDPKWCISHLFSIYEMEDINDVPGMKGPMAAYMKCLKVYFRDVRQHILQTTNLEYSTAYSPDTDNDTQLAKEGALQTGKAIVEVWNKSVGEPEAGGLEDLKIIIPNPEDWDEGATKIFYTSPAAASAADDIEYLLAHHSSVVPLEGMIADSAAELMDMCVLTTLRPKAPELLEDLALVPFTKIFKKATEGDQPGELQLEHFFVTSESQHGNPLDLGFKSPFSNDDDRDLKTFKYGQIISYSFIDMCPDFNSSSFTSTPLYSVDVGKRTFKVRFEKNDILTVRKAITENYIKPLYKGTANNEKLFIPTIHKTKKAYNMFPTFTLNGDEVPWGDLLRQKNSLHSLLYTGIFQNTCICFKTFGLTLRNPGTFIAIDKTAGSTDNDYNNKLYGQWFVVRIDRVFEAGTHVDAIYAVKIHRFKEAHEPFEAILEE